MTLVETVAVIAIVGILAAIAAPRLFDARHFEARSDAEQAAAAIALARVIAAASGCDTRVASGGATLTVSQWSACNPASHAGSTTPMAAPGGGTLAVNAASGSGFSAADLYFDGLGRPRDRASAAALTAPTDITVGTRTVRIEPQTGYVHVL